MYTGWPINTATSLQRCSSCKSYANKIKFIQFIHHSHAINVTCSFLDSVASGGDDLLETLGEGVDDGTQVGVRKIGPLLLQGALEGVEIGVGASIDLGLEVG